MKLHIAPCGQSKHTAIATCLGWTPTNELLTFSDDHQVLAWNLDGECTSKITDLPPTLFPTAMHWAPGKRQGDTFALSGADGTFHLVTRKGRIEKTVEAHSGAMTACQWSHDGTALVTVGEDGQVKIFSRTGMLRTVLVKTGGAVYSVAWGPDGDVVLYTQGKQLVVRSRQPSSKPLVWNAHSGLILAVDWNHVNNTIISGGEDRRYKIWDAFGRLIFCSTPQDYPIMSLKWAPDGDLFAVGSYQSLRLCDKKGWYHSVDQVSEGSIFDIAWSADGTHLAATAGSGSVLFGRLVDRRFESGNHEATILANNTIQVRDIYTDTTETLDFRDMIIKVSLSTGYLIVTTCTQCYIYTSVNWNTPNVIDINNGTVTLIKQCHSAFLLVDNHGVTVYNYEGQHLCTPKLSGMRPELLSAQTVALSGDILAITMRTDAKVVHVFDVYSGKENTAVLRHSTDIEHIALDEVGDRTDRQLAALDKNQDLWICRPNHSKTSFVKLGNMVCTMAWNKTSNMLAAVSDSRLQIWYFPQVVFVDRDLLEMTTYETFGIDYRKSPQILEFLGSTCSLKRAEGSIVVANVSAHPAVLARAAKDQRWEDCVRLCRLVDDKRLWACLAAMSVAAAQLDTAEVAYAALELADRVKFMLRIKKIPTVEGRNAELALFRREPEEAVDILQQAGLIYRVIDMQMRQFAWEDALNTAVTHKTHVDTVIGNRQRYLSVYAREESSKRFLQYNGVAVDWDNVNLKIQDEEEKELARPGARPWG